MRGHSSTRSERGFRSFWLSWCEFDFVSWRFVVGFVFVVITVPVHFVLVVS